MSIRLGRQSLPFGIYESELISDALAKELGDTGQDAAVLGVKLGGVGASGFLFRGDLGRNGGDTAGVRNAGFALDYAIETGEVSIGVGVSYINDIGESDTVEEAIAGDRRLRHSAGRRDERDRKFRRDDGESPNT